MDLMLQSDVRGLVDAVVWFANLRSIRSPERVAERFRPLLWRRTPLTPTLEEFYTWQRKTRSMLRVAAWYGLPDTAPEVRVQMEGEIGQFFDGVDKHVELSFEGGRLRERIIVAPKSILDACRLAAGLLFDRDHTFVKKGFYMCDAPRARDVCGRFRVSWSDEAGRPNKYCSEQCRQVGTRQVATKAQRVRRRNERGRRRRREERRLKKGARAV